MRIKISILLIIAALSSCNKDEQIDPKLELLTSGNWRLSHSETLTYRNDLLDTIKCNYDVDNEIIILTKDYSIEYIYNDYSLNGKWWFGENHESIETNLNSTFDCPSGVYCVDYSSFPILELSVDTLVLQSGVLTVYARRDLFDINSKIDTLRHIHSKFFTH